MIAWLARFFPTAISWTPLRFQTGWNSAVVLLFNVFFTCVLRQPVQNLEEGVYVCYHYDCNISNLCRLQKQRQYSASFSEHSMQMTVHWWVTRHRILKPCLASSHKPKTKQRCFSNQRQTLTLQSQPSSLTILSWKNVDSYKYLRSVTSGSDSLVKEIIVRISKASQALGRLHYRALNNHNVIIATQAVQWCHPHVTPVWL